MRKHISNGVAHGIGFETIEEKTSIGELSNKIGKNKVAKLDLEDYTLALHALHQILTGTLIYSTQRKKVYRHLLLLKRI
jgi:hypothetical protein